MKIYSARTEAETAAAAKLMIGLVESNKERYPQQLEMLETYYRDAWFFDPAPKLPEAYQPPRGDVLVAYIDTIPVGTVALGRMDDTYCELRSMFVPPARRGEGIATALCREALDVARGYGYKAVRLTTGEKQPEAQRLYQKLGFSAVAPWDSDPSSILCYFEKALDSNPSFFVFPS